MFLLRKLTTRPVWRWEKARAYPIRRRWNRLPPVAADGPVPLVVLATPADFDDAMWAAWSWLRFLHDDVRLILGLDGEPTAEHRAALAHQFPGSTWLTGPDIRTAALAWPPHLRRFVEHHPLGRKLGLILLCQRRGPLLYLDSDVLAFADPHELRAALREGASARYMVDPDQGNWDPLLVEAARPLGLEPRHRLNSGLQLLPRASLDLDTADRLLAARHDAASWFSEQTICALLFPPKAEALPPHRYIISTQRQFYWEQDVDYGAIAARHFTGPVRHVMYLKALPWLERHR